MMVGEADAAQIAVGLIVFGAGVLAILVSLTMGWPRRR